MAFDARQGGTKRPVAVHAEQTGLDAWEGAERRVLSLRLPESDIADLRFLWCELASRIGLQSNMGAQQEQLARTSTIDFREDAETRADKERDRRAAVKALEERAKIAEDVWLKSQPAHVRESLAQDVPPKPAKRKSKKADYLRGCVVAHGFSPQTMAIGNGRSGGHLRMIPHEMTDPSTGEPLLGLVSSLSPAEVWVDARNEQQSRQVKACRAALIRMQEVGDGDLVNALFLVYGRSLPPSEFPALDDLAVLALDTKTVLDHAEVMTRRLRTSTPAWPEGDDSATYRCSMRREFVTPRTALHDLIDKRHQESTDRKLARELATSTIKTEATRILICASDSYRKAKGSL